VLGASPFPSTNSICGDEADGAMRFFLILLPPKAQKTDYQPALCFQAFNRFKGNIWYCPLNIS
jgi:hypothetical protein